MTFFSKLQVYIFTIMTFLCVIASLCFTIMTFLCVIASLYFTIMNFFLTIVSLYFTIMTFFLTIASLFHNFDSFICNCKFIFFLLPIHSHNYVFISLNNNFITRNYEFTVYHTIPRNSQNVQNCIKRCIYLFFIFNSVLEMSLDQ